ncbi:MAG TPA: hypothetical protein VFU23_16920 [Gemmatimonadales bacterium]|nr:hypothetical protein [Gemmatimonadales bacterium]
MLSKFAVVMLVAASTTACGGTTGPSVALEGNFVASIFRVTPSGQATLDILAAGGSLTINITGGAQTTGTLFVPGTVTGGAPLTATMAGTAIKSGNNVTFSQTADTFVRDLTWTLSQAGLSVSSQGVAGTSYTVTLTRQ